MKRLRKILTPLLILALASFVLAGCSSTPATSDEGAKTDAGATTETDKQETVVLKVGAAQVPHAEILEFIKPTLAEQGIELEIIVPTDESSLNQQTENGEIDVNYFQHEPYLNSIVAEKKFDLVSVGGIHVEPIGAYSEKYASKEELPENAVIAIPNDGTNEYRALVILEKNGFIKLKSTIDPVTTTVNDIESYTKPIQIVELDAGIIARSGDEFDAYITNTNRIIEAGIDPNTNIFREGADSPYANIIVVKSDRVDDPAVQALYAALTTEDVKKFIEEQYKGAVVPAF
ncbi:MAG: metal ABC transporter substrate-binding protein [Coriobacteriales bacterium]|jgi:D-methionine transport system substrate-binding protein|nr:metal ABC transporter substrate-binding protein [Coriobacteriales bacterium]